MLPSIWQSFFFHLSATLSCCTIYHHSPSTFPSALLIITDSGPHEAPNKESSKFSYAFVRFLLSLRCISVCSYAPGDSALDPAERPHASLSYALSGSPIGFTRPGQELMALEATKARIGDAQFCGRPIVLCPSTARISGISATQCLRLSLPLSLCFRAAANRSLAAFSTSQVAGTS